MMHVVSGVILLDEWLGEPGPATVIVRLLDTSRMDVAARRVDEAVLRHVRLDEVQDEGIAFRLTAQELDPRARYEVSVLVDLDGDGRASVGDYLNMQSYPVLTRGFPTQVEVHVHPVGRRASEDTRLLPESLNIEGDVDDKTIEAGPEIEWEKGK